MSGSLYNPEAAAAADSYYGFPAGTLEALAGTESSYGTNLGSIGNVYQIEPATAANPGYGLGALNGNDPFDAGAYLYALETGPAGGSLSQALADYQGGVGNPTPYASNTPISNLLSSLGLGLGGAVGAAGAAAGAALGGAVGGAVSGRISWIEELAIRLAMVLIGLSLVIVGLMLAGHEPSLPLPRPSEEFRRETGARQDAEDTERETAGLRNELEKALAA